MNFEAKWGRKHLSIIRDENGRDRNLRFYFHCSPPLGEAMRSLLVSFNCRENWDIQRISNLSQVSYLSCVLRAGIQIQDILLQISYFFSEAYPFYSLSPTPIPTLPKDLLWKLTEYGKGEWVTIQMQNLLNKKVWDMLLQDWTKHREKNNIIPRVEKERANSTYSLDVWRWLGLSMKGMEEISR